MRVTSTLIAVLSAAFHLSAPAQPAAEQPQSKADDQPVGSRIKHNEAISRIPYSKAYAQLSEKEKRELRDVYEHMGPGDEPPYPIDGYRYIFQAFAKAQNKLLVEGMLDIAVTVDAEGNGTGVTVYATPDPEMAKAVAMLMMLEKYKPALCGGKPCTQQFPLQVKFSVD